MNVTKRDVDNLADLAWLIKGYLMASPDEKDLTEEHIESLRRVRLHFKDDPNIA